MKEKKTQFYIFTKLYPPKKKNHNFFFWVDNLIVTSGGWGIQTLVLLIKKNRKFLNYKTLAPKPILLFTGGLIV